MPLNVSGTGDNKAKVEMQIQEVARKVARLAEIERLYRGGRVSLAATDEMEIPQMKISRLKSRFVEMIDEVIQILQQIKTGG